jgi:phenylacetate-CoA ligase
MIEFIKFLFKNNYIANSRINWVERLFSLPNYQLLELYNDAFVDLFRLSITKSEFYKRFYYGHGLNKDSVRDLNDIIKLPVLSKQILRINYKKIYFGYKIFRIEGLTSGTSGSPAKVFRTPDDIITEHAYLQFYRNLYGFNFKQPLLSIRGKLNRNTLYKYNKKLNTLYISGPNINKQTIKLYYNLISDFNPIAIEAFPSYLYKLFLELSDINKRVITKNIFTSSEKLYDFQRYKLEPFFNAEIHDWYGNVERTICLAQDSQKSYFPLPLYSINEFESDSVITTSLINKRFPLIRYQIDDRIKVKSIHLLENIIAPEIINIDGRSGDVLELKDGSIVSCIDHAFKGVDNLLMAQINQSKSNKSIEVKVVVNSNFTQYNENHLKNNLNKMIGFDTPIHLKICDENDLFINRNSKFKLIIKND